MRSRNVKTLAGGFSAAFLAGRALASRGIVHVRNGLRNLIALIAPMALVGLGGCGGAPEDGFMFSYGPDAVELWLSDSPTACEDWSNLRLPANSTTRRIWLSSQTALAPGDYPVVSPIARDWPAEYSTAFVWRLDASCQPVGTSTSWAVSGMVTLTEIDPSPTGRAAGTYDLVDGAGQQATGSFSVWSCNPLPRGGGASLSCVP